MAYHVGTSGWMYAHWRRLFYPHDLPKNRWLAYYTEHFDTVEINNSFYRNPSKEAWDGWKLAAPHNFEYAVKASRFITHFRRFKDAEPSLKLLYEGANRLGRHLGPVLFQARPDFVRTSANIERIDRFLELLPRDVRHVLEFRHHSWFGDDALKQLAGHRVAFCSYDMPGVECPLAATTNFAYLRFHGAESKYAGDYTDDALRDWARRLRQLARDVDDVWVYFNNDIGGNAVTNAMRLRELLA